MLIRGLTKILEMPFRNTNKGRLPFGTYNKIQGG
nr:MAG TPA: hypothetical protein [Caudoviricetes sp.]